jgi:hypothetical protein
MTLSASLEALEALSVGFRQRYLDHDEVSRQLAVWHVAFPEFTRLASLGRSAEGRDIWCLAIGRAPDTAQPAAWVDGNLHASELAGSSVALAIAEDLLRLHLGGELPWVPAHLAEHLRGVLVYVVPRISPDGAETVLKTGRYVRSSPVDDRHTRAEAHWRAADLDADGFMGRMRVRHPDGEMVEAPGLPGVLQPRSLEDTGPFYKVYPEGLIEHFDGRNVPAAHFLGDNRYDLNRTFPWTWAPEHIQAGAGDFPGAMPETRAILEYTCARPNIHVWMNYHTFGGVVIRPLGDQPDSKMNQADLAIFRELEAWSKQYTGYPTVSGFEDFLYQPDTPLRGDLSDYAYHQRGCLAVVCELWDLFTQLGMPPTKPFADVYGQVTPENIAKLAAWDREHNAGRIFRPWVPFDHPQLGPVEIGGYDTRIGIWNPPYDRLEAVCTGQSAVFLRMAALVPRIVLDEVRVTPLGGGLSQVDLRVRNSGYLASYGLPSARKLPFSEPLRLTAVPTAPGGPEVVSPAERVVEIGHLEGWGRGRGGDFGFGALETHGTDGERWVRLVVRGEGALDVEVYSPRTGRTALRIPVGGEG